MRKPVPETTALLLNYLTHTNLIDREWFHRTLFGYSFIVKCFHSKSHCFHHHTSLLCSRWSLNNNLCISVNAVHNMTTTYKAKNCIPYLNNMREVWLFAVEFRAYNAKKNWNRTSWLKYHYLVKIKFTRGHHHNDSFSNIYMNHMLFFVNLVF